MTLDQSLRTLARSDEPDLHTNGLLTVPDGTDVSSSRLAMVEKVDETLTPTTTRPLSPCLWRRRMRIPLVVLTLVSGLVFASCEKRGSDGQAADTSMTPGSAMDTTAAPADSGPVPRFPGPKTTTDTAAGPK
jgi:hypothetical protein